MPGCLDHLAERLGGNVHAGKKRKARLLPARCATIDGQDVRVTKLRYPPGGLAAHAIARVV